MSQREPEEVMCCVEEEEGEEGEEDKGECDAFA
jgi:hypothetical protein